jgi:TRAP-type C4-dicarboxylate transport system substrate-binding protein
MAKGALDELSADERAVVLETGRRASKVLGKRIRREDDAAFDRLVKKMTVHEPTAAERAVWHAVWKEACTRVKEAMPCDVLDRLGECSPSA